MSAAIDNDDGATSIIPLGTPAMKAVPMIISMTIVIKMMMVMMIPIVVTLVGIVTDVSDLQNQKAPSPDVNY